MIKLIIDKIDGFHYELKNKENRVYHFNIEFFNLEKNPNIGDSLYVSEKLLKEEHALLSFGPLDGIYGRKIIDSNDSDLVVLVVNSENIYLKRYYG